FFVPLAAVLGMKDVAIWFATEPNAWMLVSVLMCIFVAIVIGLGMKAYARVQKFSFWVGNAGLAVVMLFLLFSNHAAFRAGLEANATKLFGAAPGVFDATVAAGQAAGAVTPLFGGTLAVIFLSMPYIVFFNLWPNWGATLYGEVKGADDFRKNLSGMAWALIATTALAVIFFVLVNKTITWEFMNNANAAYWNYRWGYTTEAPPLAAWPYPAMLAMFLTTSPVLQFVVLLAMSFWFFGWAGTVFLSSTRVVFAAAFDRVLPEAVATIEPRTRVPIWALALMVVPGLIVSALFVYNVNVLGSGFTSITLASTLVIAVTYLGSTIAAILLPYTKKDLYNASPIAKYKVAGLPLISVAGVIFAAFLIFLLYQWLIDPNALYGIGLKNTASMVFMGVLYLLAIVIYVVASAVRRSQGVNLNSVYKEIPAE
ncbi:MAG: hypothetical protein AABY97_07135, partial [Chloroflexota bacterium]